MVQAAVKSSTVSSDPAELERSKAVDGLIAKMENLAVRAALEGLDTFNLTVLSYQAEPLKANIPFVKPQAIDEYKSGAYQRLWKAVEQHGFEPFLTPNPNRGNDWAGADEAYSKLILAARIPEYHAINQVREASVKSMGFDPLDTTDPVGEIRRYKTVSEAIRSIATLKTDAVAKGESEFDVLVLSYQAEPAKANIPFVIPKSIDEYNSPAYCQLWKAIESLGLTPFLRHNPLKGNDWAGPEEAYSKLVVAARID